MNKAICLFAYLSIFSNAAAREKKSPSTDFPPSHSSSEAPVRDTMQYILEDIIVTGQYEASSTDKAVHKIKVIDRKKIEAMNAQNLKDVLSNELNIRLSQDQILGSSMSMQGMSGENVKILIDGVPVIGRQNGSIDLSQINLTNIERIEMVEGPMSVNFGTNALAGTINLITKKEQQNKWEAGASAYAESIGTYNIHARTGYSNKNTTILVSGGRNFFDGWTEGEIFSVSNKPVIADAHRYQQWKPRLQYFADLQYIYRIKKTTLNYRGGYFNEKITNRGLPAAPYGENAIDDLYTTYRTDNAVYLNSRLNKRKSIDAFISYNNYKRFKNSFYRDLTTLSSELTKGQQDQDTSRFTLLSSRGSYNNANPASTIHYQIGYDLSIEKAFGARIADNEKEIGDYAAFATAEYKPFDQLVIRPGIRIAYNTQYDAPLIPSVNLRYRITPELSLRTSYAKGFRAPTLKELYFYFVDVNHNIQGNRSLESENSDNFALQLGYQKRLDGKLLKLDLDAYYNDIRNLISLAQIDGAEYTYTNIGVFRTLGTQLSAELKSELLTVTLGAAYIGRYNHLSETENVNRFNYSPELRGNILYEIRKLKMTAAFFCKYTGRTPGFAVNSNNEIVTTAISDYSIADFSLSKMILEKIRISAGCKNIFDVKNVNTFSGASGSSAHSSSGNSMALATGRNYFVKLEVNLSSK